MRFRAAVMQNDRWAGLQNGGSRAENTATVTDERAAGDGPALRGKRLLVVDDNFINQEVAKGLLAAAGAEVEAVDDGEQALGLLSESTSDAYDAVLMDIQMPGMDGFEATRRILSMDGFDSLPIIGVTANAQHSDVEQMFASGMLDYVPKPIDPGELVRAILRHAGGRPPVVASSRGDESAPMDGRFDLPGALARVGGDRTLLVRLVGQFFVAHRHAIEDLRRLMEQGARHEAARLAHSLKGASGNLGMSGLEEASARLEECLEQSPAGGSDRLDHLAAAIAEAQHWGRELLQIGDAGASSQEPVSAPPDATRLQDLLLNLRALAVDHDPLAEDLLLEHRALFAAAMPRRLFDRLAEQVEGYRFSEVVGLIDSLCPATSRSA